MLSEVDAHSFKAVSGQKRDQTGVLLLQLISDIFEGFSHGVLYHFFLGLFHFFKSSVEVVVDLGKERRSLFLDLLSYSNYSIFVEVH